MDERLKQRLVGATVLVALAVIFLPMLLDGPDEYRFEKVEVPKAPAPPVVKRPDALVLTPKADGSGLEPAVKPVLDTVKDDGKPIDEPITPVRSEKDKVQTRTVNEPGMQTWVVQVGAFGQKNNALKLQQQLRDQKFPTFVEEVRVKGASSYRVRVGPLLNKDEAAKMRDQLHKKSKLNGIVMNY